MKKITFETIELHKKDKNESRKLIKQKTDYLKSLSLLAVGDTKRKQRYKKLLNNPRFDEAGYFQELLKNCYQKVCDSLVVEHKNAHVITNKEYSFQKLIRRHTRLKIYQSFWIKNHCLDLFIPQLRLAFEIDGAIHSHNEAKIRKDEYRDKNLMNDKSMKIRIGSIQNRDVGILRLRMLELVEAEKRLASSTVKNLMRNIYISTIAYHLSLNEMSEFFNVDFIKIKEIH